MAIKIGGRIKNMQYINVTGFASTGSSAVVDLLKEYSCIGTYEKEYTYEHTFLSHPEGLFETAERLETQFFGLHTDVTIRRFAQKSRDILNSFGGTVFWNGEKREKYIESVNQYIEQICTKEGEYVSCVEEMNFWRRKFEMFSILLGKISLVRKIYPQKYGWYTLKVDSEELKYYTKKLFYQYLDIVIDEVQKKKKYYVFDGLVSVPHLNYISADNFKSIVVLRDPRDRYLGEMLIKDSGEGVSIVPVEPQLYCANYKSAVSVLKKQNKNNYFLVYFEDLIMNYDKTVSEIEEFLNLEPTEHDINAGNILNINISRSNCQLYKREDLREKYKAELEIIEKNLKEYLYIENANRKSVV